MKRQSAFKTAAFAALGLGVLLAASAVFAAPAPATDAAAASTKKLSIESNVGALVDNPVTNAVIKRLAPELLTNKTFATVGRDISLRAMAQYDDALTADKLKAIDAALAAAQSPAGQ
ncbi:MAG: hypothetical protein JWM33_734 [Caulobacteraceae bacterium]|nr:hypothetical protein [Caulobacteraceae bacterium]